MSENKTDNIFDLAEKSEIVQIKSKEGAVADYIIVEADSATSADYRNITLSNASMTQLGQGKHKIEGLKGLADAEPFLVSRCVFLLAEDKVTRRPITLETVKGWPSRVTKALFEKAKALSDLGEEEATKNS